MTTPPYWRRVENGAAIIEATNDSRSAFEASEESQGLLSYRQRFPGLLLIREQEVFCVPCERANSGSTF
jgi:hypothetical protein